MRLRLLLIFKIVGLLLAIWLLSHWMTGGQDEITNWHNYQQYQQNNSTP